MKYLDLVEKHPVACRKYQEFKLKINDYNQMMAHMRRPGFDSGSPPPKPERSFTDKLEFLKEIKGGVSPSSKV